MMRGRSPVPQSGDLWRHLEEASRLPPGWALSAAAGISLLFWWLLAMALALAGATP